MIRYVGVNADMYCVNPPLILSLKSNDRTLFFGSPSPLHELNTELV